MSITPKPSVCRKKKWKSIESEKAYTKKAFPIHFSKCLPLRAVEEAQVAVPPNADNVDKQQAVLQRHQLEVGHLHKRPDHPVGQQRVGVALLQLLSRRGAFKHRHAAQEHANKSWREHALVTRHASQNGRIGRAQVHMTREKLEPGGSGRAEDN